MSNLSGAAGMALAILLALPSQSVLAQKPVAERVDDLIAAAAADVPLNGPVDDAGFARRAYLDFAGRVPEVAELRAFLTDTTADKRNKLIDSLLAGPEYPRRMQELLHVMLMERRGDDEGWVKYLRDSVSSNKPWDKLVHEILAPNADDEATRAAAYFYTSRLDKVGQQDTDYPGLTRDVGRLFLGVDLQCAQCHNHLFVDDYKQVDFQGLYVVFLNTFIRRDVKFPAIGENVLAKKIDFMSVFEKVPLQTGPRVPGREEVTIPTFAKGEEYLVPPDKKAKTLGVPRFSPLAHIANEIPSPENKAFAENAVNRVWFALIGRGLVHPLDLRHSSNLPSHPELLKLLADELVASKFDLKHVLHLLAKTKTYARSSLLAADAAEPDAAKYVVAIERPLSAEQLMWSVLTVTGARERLAPGGTPSPEFADLRKRFISAFANPPKEPEIDFSPSVRGALFLMNDAKLLALLAPADGNLADRLAKLTDAGALADELYLSVLSRSPTDEERAEVTELVSSAGERRGAMLKELTWALISSTEFCLNH